MQRTKRTRDSEKGFALLAVMILAAFLVSVLAAYFFLSNVQRSTTRSNLDSVRGYYAAEGALNVRFDALRATFDGYNRPAGVSPTTPAGQLPCQGTGMGSGDFGCDQLVLPARNIVSYIEEDATNPSEIVIPRGELYQNLRAQEYRYDLSSVAINMDQRPEAILGMRVRSRLVPIFQFAAFYNKDLEILPGPAMFFEGPVHTNGNLYIDAGTSLAVQGQVTAVNKLYNGRKNEDLCVGGPVSFYDPSNPTPIPACGSNRVEVTDTAAWNGMVRTGVEIVDVPAPEALDPVPGELYWDRADLRLMLDLTGGTPAVEVRNPDGTTDATQTAAVSACGGAAFYTDTLHNHRENADIEMLDVDLQGLLDCVYATPAIMGGRTLDDATEGGLVWYLGVDGPASNAINAYGVRVRNGAELASTSAMAPTVRGMSIVSSQALYVQGDFNSVNKKPVAFMGDSLNVLSNAWNDAASAGGLGGRLASDTTINAAFLSGTDTTGDAEGAAGEDQASRYNGGLENYPRFHEDWSGRTLSYRGSFVSLNRPRHVDGRWKDQSYSPPIRDWGYDTDFNDASKLPPLSPRFVYLTQDLFLREFEL